MKKLLFLILFALAVYGCADEPGDNGSSGDNEVVEETEITLPTKLETNGAKSFSLVSSSGVSAQKSEAMLSTMSTTSDCLDLYSLDSEFAQKVESDYSGSYLCHKKFEAYENDNAYVSFTVGDVAEESASLSTMATPDSSGQYHAIKDPSNTLHYFDNIPQKMSGFANAKMATVDGDIVTFLSGGFMYEKDLSTNAETLKFSETVTRYYNIDRANGKNWLTVGDVTTWHNASGNDATYDNEDVQNIIPINDGFMYSGALGKAKYVSIDDNGELTTGLRSNPVAFQAWLDTGGVGAMPQEINNPGVYGVWGSNFYIASKVYILPNTSTDFEVFNYCLKIGHCGVDEWANTRATQSLTNLYFYSQSVAPVRQVLTSYDISADSYVDILTGYAISKMQSSKDNILLACGTDATGDSWTIRIENANLDSRTYTYTSGCSDISQSP